MKLSTFEQTLEIIEITPLKRLKDAINLATMLEHNIPKIVSEDKEYDKIDLIERALVSFKEKPKRVEN